MVAMPGEVKRSFKRDVGEGVQIELEDKSIRAALYIVVSVVADMRAVARLRIWQEWNCAIQVFPSRMSIANKPTPIRTWGGLPLIGFHG
mgnify:CR=1 FL=1